MLLIQAIHRDVGVLKASMSAPNIDPVESSVPKSDRAIFVEGLQRTLVERDAFRSEVAELRAELEGETQLKADALKQLDKVVDAAGESPQGRRHISTRIAALREDRDSACEAQEALKVSNNILRKERHALRDERNSLMANSKSFHRESERSSKELQAKWLEERQVVKRLQEDMAASTERCESTERMLCSKAAAEEEAQLECEALRISLRRLGEEQALLERARDEAALEHREDKHLRAEEMRSESEACEATRWELAVSEERHEETEERERTRRSETLEDMAARVYGMKRTARAGATRLEFQILALAVPPFGAR